MTKINMHPSLVRFTNNQNQLELSVETAAQLVPNLCEQYPLLKACMLGPEGQLTPYVNIYINGKNLNQCLPQMTLGDTDNVDVLTALVGG